HSVENTEQLARARAEQPLKSLAEFGRLNLPTVSRADRCEHIGKNQTRLHCAGLTVELYTALSAKYGFGQAELRQGRGVEESGERQVVDRKQCPQSTDRRVAGINRLQVGGNQSGHPIIQVDDVKALSERSGKLDHRSAEKSETLTVV